MLYDFKVRINLTDEQKVKFDKLVESWNLRTDFEHGVISSDMVMGDLLYKFFDVNHALDCMLSH